MKRAVLAATTIVVLGVLAAPLLGWAQGRFGPVSYEPNVPYDGRYTYARIRYTPPEGFGGFRRDVKWDHDYPRSDRHFPKIIEAVTTMHVRTGASNIFTLDDPELMKFPVAYLCEAGYWQPTDAEVKGLRNYLLKGGFIMFDDFASGDWVNFTQQMRRVFPELHPVRLTPNDRVFDSFYHVTSLDYTHPYYGMPSEFWGFYENNDRNARLLAVVNYDNDVSEYWEWSDESIFPVAASNEAYKLGVNYLVYALTR
ncbi:MAG TPA: DUF4159 domain-containing protein [Gemmatimonadaceae bacterium]|nr:DUF4159 domain-containing protein [Gemmatimonadaceae bacterium]